MTLKDWKMLEAYKNIFGIAMDAIKHTCASEAEETTVSTGNL